jgi:hypothetical protein
MIEFLLRLSLNTKIHQKYKELTSYLCSGLLEMGAKNTVKGNTTLKQATALFIILLSLTVLFITSAMANTPISIIAIADSYVDSSYPDVNYGDSIFLYTHKWDNTADNIGPTAYTWLKFDISEIPSQATINSIILRMHTAMWGTRSINPIGVFICNDNSWTESDITWNNAPSLSSLTSLQTVNVGDPDITYDFDITDSMKGKTVVSLVLQTVDTAKQPAVFNSKDLDYAPTLVVDYSLPENTNLIPIIGIGVVAVVAVLAVFIFWLRNKKNK